MLRPAGEWNQVRIATRGANIEITLNGGTIVNYETTRSRRAFLGLQVHDELAVVKFRKHSGYGEINRAWRASLKRRRRSLWTGNET